MEALSLPYQQRDEVEGGIDDCSTFIAAFIDVEAFCRGMQPWYLVKPIQYICLLSSSISLRLCGRKIAYLHHNPTSRLHYKTISECFMFHVTTGSAFQVARNSIFDVSGDAFILHFVHNQIFSTHNRESFKKKFGHILIHSSIIQSFFLLSFFSFPFLSFLFFFHSFPVVFLNIFIHFLSFVNFVHPAFNSGMSM